MGSKEMERKGVRDRRRESASGKQVFFSCWVRVKRKSLKVKDSGCGCQVGRVKQVVSGGR